MPLLMAELSRQHHLKDSECFKTKPNCQSLLQLAEGGKKESDC